MDKYTRKTEPRGCEEFIRILWGGIITTMWSYLWTKGDKQTRWFTTNQTLEMIAKAQELANDGDDVYFGVAFTAAPKEKGRAILGDIRGVTSFAMDIDVQSKTAHKQEALPATVDEALEWLLNLILPPTMVVFTGYGIHAYWVLDKLINIDNDIERERVATIAKDLQAFLRHHALQDYGWKLDATHDLTRVLRLPGTKNWKNPSDSRNVELIYDDGKRYDIETIAKYLISAQGSFNKSNQSNAKVVLESDPGPALLVIENCPFIQYCRDNADALTEPEWFGMLSNIARCSDGPEVCHELSKPYAKYSAGETEAKIKHCLDMKGPISCEYISAELLFKGCPTGGCGVKAPIVWATGLLHKAIATIRQVKEITTESVFDEVIIKSLAVLKEKSPVEYAKFVAKCKGKVNVKHLEDAARKCKIKAGHYAEELSTRLTIKNAISDAPVDLLIPSGWEVTTDGITLLGPQDAQKDIAISPVPIVISNRIINRETGSEKVEIKWKRGMHWKGVKVLRSIAFDSRKLIQLGDQGLPVSSETSKGVVKWLNALENANLDKIPVQQSVCRMGWQGSSIFFPGAENELILDVDDVGSMEAVAGYSKMGELDQWIEAIRPLRQYPIARAMLAAAFAAPLLKVLGQRNFLIHAWGSSRGGKTAALRAAISVWGDPEALVVNFNATKVGLERMASFYNDLPIAIDERQVVGDKQGFVESLVYLLGLGKGKLRGSKTGLQSTLSFRTIALCTGEEPLSADNSTAGVMTRTLELYGTPIDDEELAADVYRWSKLYYGVAGPDFIRKLIKVYPPGDKKLVEEQTRLSSEIAEEFPDLLPSHIGSITILVIADMLISYWFFTAEEDKSTISTDDFIAEISSMLKTVQDVSDAERAWEFIQGWLASNNSHFQGNSFEPYGECLPTRHVIYIIAEKLDRALEEKGFSPAKVRRDLASAGYIRTFYDGDSKRYTTQWRFRGARPSCYVIMESGENIVEHDNEEADTRTPYEKQQDRYKL